MSQFRVPLLARVTISAVRAVPPMVTVAFAAFAVASLVAGRPGRALAALAMSLLALGVAARVAASGRG